MQAKEAGTVSRRGIASWSKINDSDPIDPLYDAQERLIRVEDGNGGTIANYGYNPFGHRMWKEIDGNRTYFFYNHSGLVGEYDANGKRIREYHYKPHQSWMTRPLFMRDDGGFYYYHNNHIGAPQKLVARSGRVVWEAKYEVFGGVDIKIEEVTNPLRFAGQYYDAESGIYHNYFRDYDPDSGRYLQSDPIGLYGGVNYYAYALNNPNKYTDPLGLFPKDILKRINVFIAVGDAFNFLLCNAKTSTDFQSVYRNREVFIEDWEFFSFELAKDLDRCVMDFEDDAGMRYQCWEIRQECEEEAKKSFFENMDRVRSRFYDRANDLRNNVTLCTF